MFLKTGRLGKGEGKRVSVETCSRAFSLLTDWWKRSSSASASQTRFFFSTLGDARYRVYICTHRDDWRGGNNSRMVTDLLEWRANASRAPRVVSDGASHHVSIKDRSPITRRLVFKLPTAAYGFFIFFLDPFWMFHISHLLFNLLIKGFWNANLPPTLKLTPPCTWRHSLFPFSIICSL